MLLTPPDGHVVEDKDTVLLTWTSVGVLADDEWYVLQVRVPGSVERVEEAWTKTTSWRMPETQRPSGDAAEDPIGWQVAVVRLVEASTDSPARIEARSPPSDTRTFYWR